MQFISQLLNGLQAGSIYALIALGYTMVYGIAKLINFAHGDILMIGAYIIVFMIPIVTQMGLPTWSSVFVAIVLCSLLGMLIEKVAYRPLRHSIRIANLITAIGISLLLQNSVMKFIGTQAKSVPQIFSSKAFYIGDLRINTTIIVTLAITLILTLALNWFMKNTSTGLAMQACAQDEKAAKLMGINVDKIISYVFALGSGLAAVGSLLYVSSYPQIEPMMGSMIGIKAFIAAVIGGVGHISGAVIGGLILGVIEALTKSYLSSQLGDAIVFAILIIVLLVKPTGIFGKNQKEKV